VSLYLYYTNFVEIKRGGIKILTVFLSMMALLIWLIALCVVFNVNFEYKNNFLRVSIKTEKNKD
jgi:hypothetical protein